MSKTDYKKMGLESENAEAEKVNIKSESVKSEEVKNGIVMDNLSVGYGKRVVIDGIELKVEPGKVLTLIGPNGSGKSTILKTITGSLKEISGLVYINSKDKNTLRGNEIAQAMSMVMTERLNPELMTCRDVVSTGRYPYTGRLGILSEEDWQKVDHAMELLHASEVADLPFHKISDGQRQRVMLARALCQETQILVLDEPTSYLDMRYKLEILGSIRRMVVEQQLAVIMSLHELDLAAKVSDTVACVSSEGRITKVGTPAEIYQGNFIQQLFGVADDAFDPRTGEMFLPSEFLPKTGRVES